MGAAVRTHLIAVLLVDSIVLPLSHRCRETCYRDKPLLCVLAFEPVSPPECFLEATDGRGGNALLFGISFVARHLRIDELHAKQLILNHFQKRPNFVQGQLHWDLLHHLLHLLFYFNISGQLTR